MQSDEALFLLLFLTNETLSEVERLPKAEAEHACSQLRELLFAAGNIPTAVGSHAWRAKMHLTHRLFQALVDDTQGSCLPSANLMNTLFQSILQDAAG